MASFGYFSSLTVYCVQACVCACVGNIVYAILFVFPDEQKVIGCGSAVPSNQLEKVKYNFFLNTKVVFIWYELLEAAYQYSY